jgi:O-acetyl-ADP-ribose deacetylase (regulator of RNase III)
MEVTRIEVIKGDITTIEADAIVNAANSSLRGGGGVDGAIHKAAGPELLEECKTLGTCETGDSKITRGYGLKAKHVIHTVGPVWAGGDREEYNLLASCYRTSLQLAKENNIRSIAFPAISTGAFGFPKELAAMIAMQETKRFLSKNELPEKVIFVVFDESNYNIYSNQLDQ